MKRFVAEIRTSLAAVAALAVILGGFYPLTVWVLAQSLYPARANGSLIFRNGRTEGSELIGQSFPGERYFHPRPSAAGAEYDPLASGGSNLGPLSRKLAADVGRRVDAYRRENGLAPDLPVPADAVTASASGLDPDISFENALLQAPRVARARGLDLKAVLERVRACRRGRDLGLLGEPRVNVVRLNLTLDSLSPEARSQREMGSPGPPTEGAHARR